MYIARKTHLTSRLKRECRFVSTTSAALVRTANSPRARASQDRARTDMHAPLALSQRAPLITSEQKNLNLHILPSYHKRFNTGKEEIQPSEGCDQVPFRVTLLVVTRYMRLNSLRRLL